VRRRDFITLLGGSAAAWPFAARAQPAVPVVAFINGGSRDQGGSRADAFRKSLAGQGYVEGQNVTVEYHWLDGQYDQMRRLLRSPATDPTPCM
jgi:putative ABC transport system substrate-binding protein